MIFNSYAKQKESLAGMHLVSCGHIFAKEGREIYRPKGREDFLLFYVAKGTETFYLARAERAKAGSFILFAPGEKQHHAYLESGTGEFAFGYYIHTASGFLNTLERDFGSVSVNKIGNAVGSEEIRH